MPQRQRSPIKSAADVPLAKLLGHERRCGIATSIAHLGRTDGPRLDVADTTEGLKRLHRRQPLTLFVLGLPQPDPGLEPAFAGQVPG